MSEANGEAIEGEKGPKGVVAGEGYACAGVDGAEGTDCARMCPLSTGGLSTGGTRKVEVESREMALGKGAAIPGIPGLVVGEVSTEFIAEFTGDVRGVVEGEGVAEPIGEFNREDMREPFRELRRGFPLERSTTAGAPSPIAVGEGAGSMAAGEDDVRTAEGRVMTTCAGCTGLELTGEWVDDVGKGTPSENEGMTWTSSLSEGDLASSSSLLLFSFFSPIWNLDALVVEAMALECLRGRAPRLPQAPRLAMPSLVSLEFLVGDGERAEIPEFEEDSEPNSRCAWLEYERL